MKLQSLIILFMVIYPSWVCAQDISSLPMVEPPAITQALSDTSKNKPESLFFTNNQLIAIARANQGFLAPSEAIDPNNQSDNPIDMGPRTVSLAGIVFNSKADWTVWINGERITPTTVPDRIMGITVKKDTVRLRWMDIANQRIVNFSLKPNQTYLLDSDTIIVGVDQ